MNANRNWLIALLVAVAVLGRHFSSTVPHSEPALPEKPMPTPTESARRIITPDTEFYRASNMPGYAEVLKMKPPVQLTSSGELLFQDHCVSCHGPAGRGDGPTGIRVQPEPTDLTHRSNYKYGSGELGVFRSIKFGVPNSAMAPWNGPLTEREAWEITRYVRILQEG